MPLKWRIYYWCSLYIATWSISLFLFYLYSVSTVRYGSDYLIFGSILFVVLLAFTWKAVLSVKTISHYKNAGMYTKKEKIFFIIGFCITAIFVLIGSYASIFAIVPELMRSHDNLSSNILKSTYARQMLLSIPLFIAIICGLYVSIFDPVLLKAIRKKYYNTHLNFGETLVDNP